MTAKNVVTAVFHFPPDYSIPAQAETRIILRNRCTGTVLGTWTAARLPTQSPWRFTFELPQDLRYNCKIEIEFDMSVAGVSQLADLKYSFRWRKDNQEESFHLSPPGYLYLSAALVPLIGTEENTLATLRLVALTEPGLPPYVLSEEITLLKGSIPRYLRYDPLKVKPGQAYETRGTFGSRRKFTLKPIPRTVVLLKEKPQPLTLSA
ncbi:hypothetical protein CCU68_29685 [Pseudomonas gingeri NCPPB 3146 = LMG 5327]|uniref:Uncharacterized protein n=2 Tax=Pseudomonas gingeri TaxID=117681 RepID=A0A7Y8CD83_9PSED|nr:MULTISPECIES: hypothetical protein [Pseudomonas]NVZ27373.1 hypothetical protein [Pseudomonas gingeri]NVZ63839.1 hypothetical protein [Pseudomonas gingeri]NVZ78679.1 hypothetical protein [Pseudomonas gingeri]NWA11853.1 hypothetical protein [Pseudomonas gingeri]NWC14995.1 hypothetical protein [Pseudomonas gingeri]